LPPKPTATIHVIPGPSVLAPFAAVVAEFPAPAGRAPATDRINAALGEFLNPAFLALVPRPLPDGAFETVVAALATALQDSAGALALPWKATRGIDGRCRVSLGYRNPHATAIALQTALAISEGLFLFLAGQPQDLAGLAARITEASRAIAARQPDPLARALQRAAARRGIPVVPVSGGARVWQLGHGSAGSHYFEAATDADGLTGSRIARNKQHTNSLILTLGFPGVRHALADSAASARRVAAEIGYPVVVKPVDGSKGRGITVGVGTPEEVDRAFAAAEAETDRGVLVEGFVAGDELRLVVVAGGFGWAVRRSPPRVTGDGTSTVAELVATENSRRRAAPNPDIAGQPLVLDAEALECLAGQGLDAESRPASGALVALGRVANVARGGTIADCTAEVHPDNRDMMEAVARALHLGAAGIDFVTADISRSWRDVPCAILEVNATPGFSSDARAELIIDRHFPRGTDGRVPAVLLVDPAPDDLSAVVATLAARGLTVGWTDGHSTGVGAAPRFGPGARLADRALGLVLDPACQALVMAATAAELSEQGLPLDRFHLVLVPASSTVSRAARSLLRECSRTVQADLPAGCLAAAAADALQELSPP